MKALLALAAPYALPLALVGAGVSFAGGWVVRDAFCDAAQTHALKKATKKNQKEAIRVNDTAGRLEDYRYENDQSTRAAQREVRIIYRDRPVSGDCDIDPAARRVLDRAIDAANASASGELGVPVPYTTTDTGAIR